MMIGTMAAGGNAYRHMYAKHYVSAQGAAEVLAQNYRSLLRRILAWQTGSTSVAS